MTTPAHIEVLLLKRLTGQLTTAETQTLDNWRSASVENERVFQKLLHLPNLQQELKAYWEAEKRAEGLQLPVLPSEEVIAPKPVHRVHLLKTAWVRYAAAIIVILGIGAYLWNNQQHPSELTTTTPVPTEKAVLPGSHKAVLTLSDGRQLELDSTLARTYIEDGDAGIASDQGALTYKGGATAGMNTMTTPKGGQYKLQLADGTTVWLNAASSLTYPTAFTGTTREVRLQGEAYFEVAKNARQPFMVRTGRETIRVLGTSFNVNSYADEPGMKTSLVEGSVKIGPAVLRPGQAWINGTISPTNIAQDIAWKNGTLNFSDMDIAAVFRMLSRWYNVEVVYPDGIPDQEIVGKAGRDLTLQEVLQVLTSVGIHTRLSGNQLVVYNK